MLVTRDGLMLTYVQRIALSSLLAAAVATTGCGGKQAQQRRGSPSLAVDVAPAARHDIATSLSLDGQVAPLLDSTLATQASGTVTGLYANEGDRVSRGQLLAKIDDSTLRAQLAAAQARLAGSSEQLPMTQQQTSADVTTANEGIRNARNSLSSAQASYDAAKTTYDSNNQLFKQGFVAKTALDASRAQYVAALQVLNNAKIAVSNAQTAARTAQQNTGRTGVQVSTVASDRANVQLLMAQIAQTSLYAPFDGVVTQRFLDPGAIASPNTPIFKVSQLSSVYVNANVPDDSLAYVKNGQPVSFTTSSNPGRRYSGRISSLNAVPTAGTLSYRARIVQSNSDLSLRGGMLVTITVPKELHKSAIVVPRSAVFQSETGPKVFTVAKADKPAAAPGAAPAAGAPAGGGAPGGGGPPLPVAHEVPVKLGLQTDTEAEVISPLIRPGTVVITTRPDALQDGSTVAVGGPGGPPSGGPGGAKKRSNQRFTF